MIVIDYVDEWGHHSHTSYGPPYDPKLPIDCPSCLGRLNTLMSEWLDTLTERHSLPENFWVGHRFSWQ